MKKTITLKSRIWTTEQKAKSELLKKIENLPITPEGLNSQLETKSSDVLNYSPKIEQTKGEETVDKEPFAELKYIVGISPKGYRALDTLILTGEEDQINTYVQQMKK